MMVLHNELSHLIMLSALIVTDILDQKQLTDILTGVKNKKAVFLGPTQTKMLKQFRDLKRELKLVF